MIKIEGRGHTPHPKKNTASEDTKIVVWGGDCSGDVANTLESNIVVSEFELQSHYYVHPWKRYELPYLPSAPSARMAFALNNPWQLICHRSKKSKPNQNLEQQNGSTLLRHNKAKINWN